MSIVRFVNASLMIFLLSLSCYSANAADMTISGTPTTTVKAGEYYSFLPAVTNADRSQLQFTYTNKPSWSKHYRSSGLIAGRPTEPGVYSGIQIEAWDGLRHVSLPSFTITVTPASINGNQLAIYGTPPTTAKVGQFYNFSPTVVATAGSALQYSVAHKPVWAQFSTTTGALSGTPTAASSALAADIVISVSDGTTSASLPPFTLDVSGAVTGPVVAGVAYLTWTKPIVNSDGSLLTNLAGYTIRYGTSATNLSMQIVASAASTEAQIENLQSGTWYFEIAAVNSANVTSSFTPIVGSAIL